jgi:hypothetical protein
MAGHLGRPTETFKILTLRYTQHSLNPNGGGGTVGFRVMMWYKRKNEKGPGEALEAKYEQIKSLVQNRRHVFE